MDNCTVCKPGHLCDEHLERDFERMRGVVASRADQYLREVRAPGVQRPSTTELQLEAAHWVRDMSSDERLRERYSAEFIMWLAIRSIMPEAS